MRVHHNQGVAVSLGKEDRKYFESQGKELSCKMDEPHDYISFTLKVTNRIPQGGFMEERGFHLSYRTRKKPIRNIENSVWDYINSITLWFSEENFLKLVQNYRKNPLKGGCFMPRGPLDRHVIFYSE